MHGQRTDRRTGERRQVQGQVGADLAPPVLGATEIDERDQAGGEEGAARRRDGGDDVDVDDRRERRQD